MPLQALRVSVVVPTVGRAGLLERCLDALGRQTLDPRSYEVIVVDDRPGARTLATVSAFGEQVANRALAVHYVASYGPHGPAAARNAGWRAARADVIAFTDDDTEPDADWLAKGLAALGPDVDAVSGRIVMPIPRFPTDYERDAQGLERSEFVTANCFCRRALLERLGGFDERFRLAWREDSDLHFRLLESGARIVRSPDALVVHPVRPAGWGVSVRQQKKVLFDALLFKKHRRLYRERIRRAPRWDYYVIVAALAATPLLAARGQPVAAACAVTLWLALTARLCALRLRGTSKEARHVSEMIVTSALIPPLAVFWRLVGALRFRVMFV